MLHFYLRCSLFPLILFTAALLIIHAQPYDDHELRQLLLPERCPAPCFMDIRPGVTTKEGALQILQTNAWVKHYDYQEDARIIRLTWSEDAPSWLASQREYASSFIAINSNLVSEIQLDTELTLADIQLTLGASLHQKVYFLYQEGYTLLSYSAIYPKIGVFTSVFNSCDGKSNSITYRDKVSLGYAQLTYLSDIPYKYDSTWADLLRASCNHK